MFGHFNMIHADGVRMVGHVPDRELRALYEHALALVFPSLYEGFGLPPLEAMTCGCPVMISEQPALIEVCGDAALRCRGRRRRSNHEHLRRSLTTPACARGSCRRRQRARAALHLGIDRALLARSLPRARSKARGLT